MNKSKKYVILLIFLIVLFAIVSFKFVLKDSFNMFLELIYMTRNEKLMISDELVDNYIKQLEGDISEYKKVSNLNSCINSTVIYRNPSIWYDEFTINKGIKDNIKVGNMVINHEGIVGIVSNVYDNSSIVSLITNINTKKKITVGIKVEEEVIYGLISNYDKIRNEITISELTKDISINGGESIVTTNFTSTFKEGLIIAKVKNIIDDDNGLSKNVIATQSVNYNNIRYVCVME